MTVFSKETAVLMIGEFSDKPSDPAERAKINRLNLWYKPWFYKYVSQFLVTGEADEYVPTRHWFHRHTRSIFWYMEELVPFGNQWWYRYFFAWLGAPKIAFLKWSVTPKLREESVYSNVAQDILVPLTELQNAINLCDNLFEICTFITSSFGVELIPYPCIDPLLFYPVKIFPQPQGFEGFVRNPRNVEAGSGQPGEMFFDLGVYGVPPVVKKGGKFDAEKSIRSMEHYTRSVGGYQLMYADTFMCREEFEEVRCHRN